MKLIEMIKIEKAHMNKVRFIVNYVIVPIYWLVMAICLIIISIFMIIDEIKYTPLAIFLFCFLGLISILLLFSVRPTRNLEIKIEMSKYIFDDMNITPKSEYLYEIEEKIFLFNKMGVYYNELFYWYGNVPVCVVTSNKLNLITYHSFAI